MGYYLADDINASWSTFANNIPNPTRRKQYVFSTAQEACKKDTERAFGVFASSICYCLRPSSFIGQ
jgi:hypothetical protein